MIKEMGSYCWDIPISDNINSLFPLETKWFISGRSAILAIIEDIKKYRELKSVSLPDWCCDSMILPFLDNNIEIHFYCALDKIIKANTDAILIMDYFGFTNCNVLEDFEGIVIRDITQSLFSKSYDDADYYVGSLRKWAGFYTGGFAWGFRNNINFTKEKHNASELRKIAIEKKKKYINNSEENNKDYYELFIKAEEFLYDEGIVEANERDIKLAHYLDVNKIKKSARDNAKIIMSNLSDFLMYKELNDTDCPFIIPILVEDRDTLRKYLCNKNIYCPIHWQITKYHRLSKKTNEMLDKELGLMCDYRYSEDDIKYMIKLIKEYMIG